jgi:PAS domain S-box-containing protein
MALREKHRSRNQRSEEPMRIGRRLLVAFLLVVLFPLLLAQYVVYVVGANSLTRRVLSQLESVAAVQEQRIEGIHDRNLERLSLVSSRTQLRLSLAAFVEDAGLEHQTKMKMILRDALASTDGFEEVSVLTLDGRVAASTDPAETGRDRSEDEAFLKGRKGNSADTFLLDEKNRVRIFLSGPLVLDGRPLGVVVVRSRADTILAVVSDFSGLGETGETILARPDERGNAQFLAPLRFDPDAALQRTVPREQTNMPIMRALSGEEFVLVEGSDYRGEPVLAATRHVEGPGWSIVVKIDRAEALAPVAGLRRFLVLIALVSTAAVIAVALWLGGSITKPVVDLLRRAGRLAGEDASDRPDAGRTGEFGELAGAFDEAARRLESSRAELLKINRALRVLSGCNTALVRATGEQELLQEACRIVVEVGGYRLAWAGEALQDESKTVRPVAQAGYEDGYLDTVNITWADTERGRGPTGTAIREGVPSVSRNIPAEPRFAPWRAEAARRGYASSLALPLRAGDRTFGALNIYAAEPNAFDEDETKLLQELADNLAYGVESLRARAARESAEAALELSEDRYRTVFDAAPVGIGMADTDGNVYAANRRMEELTGYTPEELQSTGIGALYADAEDRRRLLRALRERGEVRDFEAQLRRKDGAVYHALLNVDLVEMGGRQVLLTTARDITARRQLEAQLLQSQKMEAIGRLAGGIAHDFNNMMQIVTGYAYRVMADLAPEDPKRKSVEGIKQAGERAAALTHQLLAFSRKQILNPTVTDLNAVVSDIDGMLRRVLGEDVALVTVLHPELGRVKADRVQIEQAIMNLAINARDAMPRGGKITIETGNVELGESHPQDVQAVPPGAYVMLAVSDTGCGMDEETRSHIFEPFFTTKEPGEGTGLGLSTAYGTIRQSGGVMRVHSEPGHGTTFRIYLPRVEGPVVPEAAGEAEPGQRGGTETILLVEDDDNVRDLVAVELRERGYTLLEGRNGDEAVLKARLHEGRIDLLVTDVVLPGRSGRETYEGVLAFHPGARVLYMSGHDERHVTRRGVLAPGTCFLAAGQGWLPADPAALFCSGDRR